MATNDPNAQENAMKKRPYASKETNPYLGQECRIVRAYRNLEGRQSYALKTATQTVAISADKALLIDLASDRWMNVTEIED